MTDETRTPPKAGDLWRHCKGTLYQIIGFARHTEKGEDLVLYRVPNAHEFSETWARPLPMFLDRHSSGAWRFERADEEMRTRQERERALRAEIMARSQATVDRAEAGIQSSLARLANQRLDLIQRRDDMLAMTSRTAQEKTWQDQNVAKLNEQIGEIDAALADKV